MHAVQARYEILRSCLAELQRVGVLGSSAPAPPPYTAAMQSSMVCHDSPWPTVVHGSAAHCCALLRHAALSWRQLLHPSCVSAAGMQ